MVCRTVMQYLVAGSGPPGHEIWPEMEMWVGDTPSAGDISRSPSRITFYWFLPVPITLLLGAAPLLLPPGNMEYGLSAGVRLLHNICTGQEIFHDRHNLCLNCSQLSLSITNLTSIKCFVQ